MPDIVTHTTVTLPSAATSGGIVYAIGMSLGVDPVAIFCSFMGALAWIGIQPKIELSFFEIHKAFWWAVIAMVLGTLGGMAAGVYILNNIESIKEVPHVAAVGLPSFMLALVSSPAVTKGLKYIKNWKEDKK